MNNSSFKKINRGLSVLLVLLLLIGSVPVTVFAANGAKLSTDIGEKSLKVGVPTEFTLSTVANDDADTNVVGSVSFSDADAVEKFELLGENNEWNDFNGSLGSEEGFLLSDSTKSFRVTFKKDGSYSFNASVISVESKETLASVSASFDVAGKSKSELSSDISEQEFVIGEKTEFSLSVVANDYAGTNVILSLGFAAAGTIERFDSETEKWTAFEEKSFSLSDKTIKLRASFETAGNNSLSASLKYADGEKSGETLCTTGSVGFSVLDKYSVALPTDITGGKVTLDREGNEFVEGTKLRLTVTPDENYYISRISFNGSDEQFEKTGDTKDFVVESDTVIDVTFVEVFTVEVQVDGNGNVETVPAQTEGGTVKIITGNGLTYTATPNTNYRVGEVSFAGNKIVSFEGYDENQGEAYVGSLTPDKSGILKVTFVPCVYVVECAPTQNGIVSISKPLVEHGEDVTITISPSTGYCVDSVTVNGKNVEESIENVLGSDTVLSLTLSDVTENKYMSVKFTKIATIYPDSLVWNLDTALRVSTDGKTYIFANNPDKPVVIRPVTSVGYYIKIKATKDGASNKTEFTGNALPLEMKYIRFYPKDFSKLTIENRDIKIGRYPTMIFTSEVDFGKDRIHIVFDKVKPTVSVEEPEADKKVNGYYTSNVKLKINANDTDDYSGLKEIRYWVKSNGNETVPVTKIYEFSENDGIRNTLVEPKEVVIDASKNNSDKVVVYVQAVDRAGNESAIKEVPLKICNTAPSVSLKFDDSQNTEATGNWYNFERTATITVVDRADVFDSAAASDGFKFAEGSSSDYVISAWTNNGDNHSANVTFKGEGTFNWEYSYKNSVGLSAQVTAIGENVYSFGQDLTVPSGKLSASSDSFAESWNSLLEKLTFGLYSKSAVSIVLSESSDNLSNVQEQRTAYYLSTSTTAMKESDLISLYNAGKFSAESVTVDSDSQFAVYARIVDNAGNARFIGTKGIIYDVTVSKITFEAVDVANENSMYGVNNVKEYTVLSESGEEETIKGIKYKVTAKDLNEDSKESYSGINRIDYRVFLGGTTVGSVVQSGTLFSFDKKDPEKEELVSEKTCDVIIDASKCNGENVVLEVTVTDNAGNKVTNTTSIKEINLDVITAKVSIKGKSVKTVGDFGWYRDSRVATITITDRASCFVAEEARNAIKVVGTDLEGNLVALSDEDLEFGTWESNGDDHTITVTFAGDANYSWGIDGYTNKAGNKLILSEDNSDYSGETPRKFAVDANKPSGSVTVGGYTWVDKLFSTITFGIYSPKKLSVSATSSDSVSPTKIEYYVSERSSALSFRELDSIYDDGKDFGETVPELKDEQQATVYVRITDNAGNYTYASSDGFVIDPTQTDLSVSAIDEANNNGIYGIADLSPYTVDGESVNGIRVSISAEEAENSDDSYSGIKSITYEVSSVRNNVRETTQSGTLYSFDYTRSNKDDSNGGKLKISEVASHETTILNEVLNIDGAHPTKDELCRSWAGCFIVVVDEEKNNSCATVVEVTVTDNAGNSRTESLNLDIDYTAPAIALEYNNNASHNDTYYDAARIATLTFTERPDHFDLEAANNNIHITAKDYSGNNIEDAYEIGWQENIDSYNPDNSTFVATIRFLKDANYTLKVVEEGNVGYTDKAGNTARSVYDEFTVDTVNPTGVITVNESSWSVFLSTITFGLFDKDKAQIVIEAFDETSPVKIEYAVSDGISEALDYDKLEFSEYTGPFEFDKDKQFDIYAKITDYASHSIIINSDGYIVDREESVLSVVAEDEANDKGIYGCSDIKPYTVDGNPVTGIKVAIRVNEDEKDTDVYSGIKKISYAVKSSYKGAVVTTQEGVLYSFDYVRDKGENSNGGTLEISEVGSYETTKLEKTFSKQHGSYPKKEQLLNNWEGAIIVDAYKNNSSDTVVEVTVTDNAGNVRTEKLALDINVTDPLINVSYDNNDAKNKKYFNAQRTATVTITERSNHFSSENATNGIVITTKNLKKEDISAKYRINEWKENKNEFEPDKTTHTATIEYLDDANYTFDISYVGRSGNRNKDVIYAENTVAANEFTVDTEAPQEASVSVNTHIWTKLLEVLTFGLYSNSEADIEMFAYDIISPVTIEYYKTNDPVIKDESFLNEQKYVPYNDNKKPVVKSDEQFVYYVKVTDYAGNYRYISTDGYIVDQKAAEITLVPDEANKNGVYGNDVNVEIKVKDGEPYSGIARIEYWVIKNHKEETQREVLYSFDYTREEGENCNSGVLKITDLAAEEKDEKVYSGNVPTQKQLRQSWNKTVTVDSDLNNSCDVELFVGVTDNAGNYSEKSQVLDIDIVAPVIDVTYDETRNDNAVEGYFTSRTATVKITERTHHFDAIAATEGIKIIAVDAEGNPVESGYTILGWSTEEGETPDEAVHTATISYDSDANYTFSIDYTDNADHKNEGVNTNDSVAPFKFTVDSNKPTGSITAKSLNTDKSSREETWNDLVENLVFGFWSNKKVSVSGTSHDDTSPIMSVDYYMPVSTNAKDFKAMLTREELDKVSGWKEFNSLDIKANAQFVVYLRITDNAGNYTYISTNGLLVDDTHPLEESVAPEISVEPEVPVNGIYSKDVKVSIKVTDPEVSGAYSGLKNIRYAVFDRDSKTPNKPTQEGKLFTFNNKSPKQSELVQSFDGKIVVKASKNNSNNIQIAVYATDNSGNYVDNVQSGSQSYTVIKIDKTAPVVNISYDNNRADSGYYFNANRTATIKIIERNFDPADVEITTSNTDGKLPTLSGWKTTKGTYNKDDTVHIATLSYTADGDYKFNISYTDKAGLKAKGINYGSSVAPGSFTVDKTAPRINVSYDNNASSNGNYYTSARTATIVINEHNFSRNRINISLSATNGSAGAAVPAVNGWSTSGNNHVATIRYPGDAHYVFGISYTDLAGNRANSYAGDNFYVDNTDPELEITGVENNSANGDVVRPIVTASDTNFDDVRVTLVGANRGQTNADGSSKATENGKTFTFADFERKQSVDDIYTLSAVATDKAGRSTKKTISFSVNRFGSVYAVDELTKKLNGTYIQEQQDVVINEINANKLSKIKLTLFKNNETITLKEGRDYTIAVTGGNGSWYKYVYTIFKANFEDDGVYKLTLHSEDAAGNIAENTLDTKQTEINFGVDKTVPTINVKNLESGKTYPVDSIDVMLAASDNLKLSKVSVLLDGSECASWSETALEEIINSGDDFTFVVAGDSKDAHEVKIIAVDAAGNKFEQDVSDFYVTTNLWVRYFNNKALFFGSIAGFVILIALVIFLVISKRKRVK